MDKNMRKPSLRFKGFTDDWEQYKLGDLGFFKSNGVDKLSKPNEIPVNLLNYMDVYNRREVSNKNANELMQVTAKPSQLIENSVMKNDVFFTPTSETPQDIGRVYVIEETLNNTVYSYHLMRFRPNQGTYYPNFPNYSLMTENVRKQFFLAAKGVQRYVISKADFESIVDTIPEYKEQAKIGEFFRSIDSLITLHQRKYDKLVNIKKSLLEKMFPQNGESIPRLRFKGFTDAWEQYKLEEIGTIITGSTPPTSVESYYSNDGIPWVTPTDISEHITYKTERMLSQSGQNAARVVPKNTLLVTSIASIGKNTLLGSTGSFNQQINGIIPNSKHEPYFLYSASNHWSNNMKKMGGGLTFQIVNKTEFSQIETLAPKKAEQTKIGELFRSLDNLITLHQRKYEKLQNIKKALLQKMFV